MAIRSPWIATEFVPAQGNEDSFSGFAGFDTSMKSKPTAPFTTINRLRGKSYVAISLPLWSTTPDID